MKLSIVLYLLLFVSGCVTADQYTEYLHKQFIGKSMDSAIDQYGPPSASAPYKDGKVYEWTRSMGYRSLATDMGGPQMSTVERTCTWRVVADKQGLITQAGWQGNACYNQLQPLPKN